jgi:uncharacterized protein YjbI with pentapeptide repeats
MNKVQQFLARVGRDARLAMPVSLFRRAVGVVLFLVVLAGLVVAVQIVPEWQVKRASVRSAGVNPEAKTTPADVAALQNEMRKTFLQVVGGAFALFALYLTFRRVKVAEQGHITDRYTKAIEQLGALTAAGKPNVEVRLGAIYALERIAIDSPRDHWTIMEVLTAYVRQNAPTPTQAPTEEENQAAIWKGPATEIQAILTVLGRRKRGFGREHEGQRLDLSASDLRGAIFVGPHLERALFSGTHLEGSHFKHVHVEGASFDGAHLREAHFILAHVERASFLMAHVEGVSFLKTNVEGAWFNGVHMEGAHFSLTHVKGARFNLAHIEGASFLKATGLTVEQFLSAKGWERAEFDEAFLQELRLAKEKTNHQE